MFDFTTFIFGFLSGIVLMWIWYGTRLDRTSGSAQSRGLRALNEQAIEQKHGRKELILAALDGKKSITNNDVEKLFEVSDATATNYLSELEREGKIVQVGRTGRNVIYKRKING